MNSIDLIFVVGNFGVFVYCCMLLLRKYEKSMRQHKKEEDLSQARLLEYHQRLHTDVENQKKRAYDQEHECVDLITKVHQWKQQYAAKKQELEREKTVFLHNAERYYQTQLSLSKLQKLRTHIAQEVKAQATQQLQKKYAQQEGTQEYTRNVIQALKERI